MVNGEVLLVSLVETPLDPEGMRRLVSDPRCGGVTIFVGDVRSVTGSEVTEALFYEAHPTMALAQMKAIADEAASRWSARVAIAHRTGLLKPGETAVVCAAACAHRAEAFECCRFLIESLKADVPIWKKDLG